MARDLTNDIFSYILQADKAVDPFKLEEIFRKEINVAPSCPATPSPTIAVYSLFIFDI